MIPSANQTLLRSSLRILLAANNFDAQELVLENSGNKVVARYILCDDDVHHRIAEIDNSSVNELKALFSVRSFLWPDMSKQGFQHNNQKTKSVLLAPLSGLRAQSQYRLVRETEATIGNRLVFQPIMFDNIPHILDVLNCSPSQQSAISTIQHNKVGLAIGNISNNIGQVDGRAVLLALRPDALYFPCITNTEMAEQAVSLANESLVICGINEEDPVSMLMHLSNLFDSKHLSSALSCLHCIYMYSSIPRVCPQCARSTAIEPATLDAIPKIIRPFPGSGYMSGKGCNNCENSTYHGTVGLGSAIELNNSIRNLVIDRQYINDIAKAVYQSGTRTLIEDGLEKIKQGLTNYEAVLKAAPRIPPCFESAIESKHSFFTESQQDPASSTSSLKHELPLRPPKSEVTMTSEKTRLLLVEDDEDQRRLLETLFRTEGFDVLTAENGIEALEILDENTVDLVISDLMMPKMNGSELVKRIRATKSLKSLPILMLTAIDNPDVEYALLDAGADAYCPKRVKKKILLKRIERLLNRATL